MTFELASEQKTTSHRIEMLNGGYALVDPGTYEKYHSYPWYKVRFNKTWYAKAIIQKGRRKQTVFLHRLVAKTQRGMVCHHKNQNGLDCREANLWNMTKDEHHRMHMTDRLRVKFTNDFGREQIKSEVQKQPAV